MVGVRAGIVIRHVAAVAGVRRIGVIAVMTGIAIVGNGNVASRKRIHGTMIKSSGRPGIYTVTSLASGRKTRSGVIRISRRIVVGRVTPEAGGRRVVVIAVRVAFVATGAGMRARERPVRIVHREGGGRPVRRGGVARRAVGRQV